MAATRKDVPARYLLGGAFAILLVFGTLTWFMIPDPQAQIGFVAPSGRSSLHLSEYCAGETCSRRVVAQFVGADGATLRRGCAVDLPAGEQLFADPKVAWASDEQSVEISYAGGTLPLTFATDCTLTE
jgi:hypothetical protein